MEYGKAAVDLLLSGKDDLVQRGEAMITYLSSLPNDYNLKDKQNFSRYYPKRLKAEVLYDALHQVTATSQNYTGLPVNYHINTTGIYRPPLHNAIIVTDDYTIYQFVLFPLNDPFLHNDILYALASNEADYSELHTAFPGKHLYQLHIAANGSVSYTAI